MKKHFEREALWMVVILLGPLLVGLVATIMVKRCAHKDIMHRMR
jgi:hypothetical protein